MANKNLTIKLKNGLIGGLVLAGVGLINLSNATPSIANTLDNLKNGYETVTEEKRGGENSGITYLSFNDSYDTSAPFWVKEKYIKNNPFAPFWVYDDAIKSQPSQSTRESIIRENEPFIPDFVKDKYESGEVGGSDSGDDPGLPGLPGLPGDYDSESGGDK